jgi:hypothetical protein
MFNVLEREKRVRRKYWAYFLIAALVYIYTVSCAFKIFSDMFWLFSIVGIIFMLVSQFIGYSMGREMLIEAAKHFGFDQKLETIEENFHILGDIEFNNKRKIKK